jgi:hypothetical protein
MHNLHFHVNINAHFTYSLSCDEDFSYPLYPPASTPDVLFFTLFCTCALTLFLSCLWPC